MYFEKKCRQWFWEFLVGRLVVTDEFPVEPCPFRKAIGDNKWKVVPIRVLANKSAATFIDMHAIVNMHIYKGGCRFLCKLSDWLNFPNAT